jgi:hypothetical protein
LLICGWNHFTGNVAHSGIGIGCSVVEKVSDSICSIFAEARIDCLGIIEEGANNFLETQDAVGVEGGTGFKIIHPTSASGVMQHLIVTLPCISCKNLQVGLNEINLSYAVIHVFFLALPIELCESPTTAGDITWISYDLMLSIMTSAFTACGPRSGIKLSSKTMVIRSNNLQKVSPHEFWHSKNGAILIIS